MFLGDYLTVIQYLIDHAFDGNKYTCCFNEIRPVYDGWTFKTDTATYLLNKSGTITKITFINGDWKTRKEELIYAGMD